MRWNLSYFLKFEKDLFQLYTILGSMRRLIMWQCLFYRMRRKHWTRSRLICSRTSWIHHDLDKWLSISETFLSLFTCHLGYSWLFLVISGHLWTSENVWPIHFGPIFGFGWPDLAHLYIYSIFTVLSLFQMNSIFMFPQINFSLKCFATISTSKRLHPLMFSHMCYQVWRLWKWFSANSTIVRFFA